MKRFLFVVCIVAAAIYAFPPHTGPRSGAEATFVKPHGSGPLRTSWGSTLQALKQEPTQSKDIASSPRPSTHGHKPRQGEGNLLVVGGSEADPLRRARETLAAYSSPANTSAGFGSSQSEMWVIGQTNGWIQPESAGVEDEGWTSYAYIEPVDEAPVVADADNDAVSAEQQPSRPAARIAKAPEPQTPAIKSRRDNRVVSDDTQIAKPNRPRGLFTRAADGQRGRGLFGLFKARKVERRAWSVGPSS
jgi:hypothetical protein